MNFADYVATFRKQKCFITITNFRRINFANLQYPVVVKFPRLVALLANIGSYYMRILSFWLPHELYPKNGSIDAPHIIKRNCQISKFLPTFWEDEAGFGVIYDYCLRIINPVFFDFPLNNLIVRLSLDFLHFWNCMNQHAGLFTTLEP